MKRIWIWIGILFGIYFGFIAYLTFFQDQLIFLPEKTTDENWTAVIEELSADYMSIITDDGETLEGMFLSDKSGEPRPTIIVFYGNAMRVENAVYLFRNLPEKGINVLLMDYRGYGFSTGEPNINAMKRDAQKIFDAAAGHPYVDEGKIAVFGISLGSGIATHVASVKPVSRVILMSPMTSLVDVSNRSFPIVPKFLIRFMLEHKIENLALAPNIKKPALIIHGSADIKIPYSHAEAMAEAWGGDVKLLILDGRGHNDLWGGEEMWQNIETFLAE